MKIRKIEFVNHPIFKDLKLDFTDSNGNTLDTIIIAGENGVGKTVLLESIYEFTNLVLSDILRDEKRYFEIEFSNEEINILKSGDKNGYFNSYLNKNIIKFYIDYNQGSNWNQIKYKIEEAFSNNASDFGSKENKKVLSTIYSDVEINFNSKTITNVTSLNIDQSDLTTQRSNSNLANEIVQLLIDIQHLDALDFQDWARKHIGQKIENEKMDLRLKRFTSSFNLIFPTKKFKRIDNSQNKKDIIFEEYGKEMSINKLSSGEKQIVFRGSFLLKNIVSLKGALVLIDEPEISLHPNWQLKILNFLKSLFTNYSGVQTSQIIIATHSPFIIHNTERYSDKVIIMKKNLNGRIYIPNKLEYFGWTPEKIVEEAFNISNLISSNKVIVLLEGETDEKYFNTCLSVYNMNSSNVEFKWVGRIDEKGNKENTGFTALNNAKTFLEANREIIKNKIILLYDNDTKKLDEEKGKLLIKCMKFNIKNTVYKKGVENLLIIEREINYEDFYIEKPKTDDYGAKSIIRKLDKTKLCNYICDTLDIEKKKIILKNIKEEIENILNIN